MAGGVERLSSPRRVVKVVLGYQSNILSYGSYYLLFFNIVLLRSASRVGVRVLATNHCTLLTVILFHRPPESQLHIGDASSAVFFPPLDTNCNTFLIGAPGASYAMVSNEPTSYGEKWSSITNLISPYLKM